MENEIVYTAKKREDRGAIRTQTTFFFCHELPAEQVPRFAEATDPNQAAFVWLFP